MASLVVTVARLDLIRDKNSPNGIPRPVPTIPVASLTTRDLRNPQRPPRTAESSPPPELKDLRQPPYGHYRQGLVDERELILDYLGEDFLALEELRTYFPD